MSISPIVDNKMNGNGERTPNPAKAMNLKNYKLVIDPFLTGKKEPKVIRYEGIIQGETVSTVVVRDPRNHLTARSKRIESLDLPLPR